MIKVRLILIKYIWSSPEKYSKSVRWNVILFCPCTPLTVRQDCTKRKALCFREALIIGLKHELVTDTKPIGGYCILTEAFGPQAREFLVHVQSSMTIDGHFGGSKVISSATEKFHCLEENRTEFLCRDDGEHKKTMFIGIEDDSYHVKLTRTCSCDETVQTKNLSFCCNKRFISEGVNILLMRYLALINYQGTLTFQSITMDGDITQCEYNCTAAEHMEIDKHYLNIYTIERKIYIKDEWEQISKTYLTTRGRIIKHNWVGVPYILKINPLQDPNIIEEIKFGVPLRDRWWEDIEMLSKYLDAKQCKMAEQIEYLADHPEIKQLIADYAQTLLVVKPTNVIDFTIQHFKAFAREPKAFERCVPEKDSIDDLKVPGRKSAITCSICGFFIDSEKNRSEEMYGEESCDTIIFHDSTQSLCSKCGEMTCFPRNGNSKTTLSSNSTEINF